MEFYDKMIRKLVSWGEVVSGFFLLVIMVLVVSNIIVRLMGGALRGTYELVEMGITVTASLAIVYTTIVGGHVTVKIVSNFLSNRTRVVLSGINAILCLFTWGLIAYMSVTFAIKKGLGEYTDQLGISILPCRIVWIYAMVTLVGVYLLKFFFALKGKVEE